MLKNNLVYLPAAVYLAFGLLADPAAFFDPSFRWLWVFTGILALASHRTDLWMIHMTTVGMHAMFTPNEDSFFVIMVAFLVYTSFTPHWRRERNYWHLAIAVAAIGVGYLAGLMLPLAILAGLFFGVVLETIDPPPKLTMRRDVAVILGKLHPKHRNA